MSQDQDRWRAFIKEVKVHHKLQHPQKKAELLLPMYLFEFSSLSVQCRCCAEILLM
jgi:hypothetical protein